MFHFEVIKIFCLFLFSWIAGAHFLSSIVLKLLTLKLTDPLLCQRNYKIEVIFLSRFFLSEQSCLQNMAKVYEKPSIF